MGHLKDLLESKISQKKKKKRGRENVEGLKITFWGIKRITISLSFC